MNFIRQFFAKPKAVKASRAGSVVAMQTLGQPRWTPRDYAALAREGFMQNPVCYRAVRMLCEAAASLPILLYAKDQELTDHPLLDLLNSPNPRASNQSFMESVYGHLLTAGNAYIEAVSVGHEVRELHVLRPDRMRLVAGVDGYPSAYEYTVGTQSVRFDMGTPTPVPPILHLTLFHPLDDHYGMAPIEAAACALDIHNAASVWSKALLDNAARPSGALVFSGESNTLSDDQFERLKEELEDQYQGAKNAGRPLLLEGGLDWKSMALTPKDMDFIESKNAAARDIALAFGVPPMLLGIPGDNTYANYAEANKALYRQTILPLINRTMQALSQWLVPLYNQQLTLRIDEDKIEALHIEREALWNRLENASFLSTEEKRISAGYSPNM